MYNFELLKRKIIKKVFAKFMFLSYMEHIKHNSKLCLRVYWGQDSWLLFYVFFFFFFRKFSIHHPYWELLANSHNSNINTYYCIQRLPWNTRNNFCHTLFFCIDILLYVIFSPFLFALKHHTFIRKLKDLFPLFFE